MYIQEMTLEELINYSSVVKSCLYFPMKGKSKRMPGNVREEII